ncbi:hypothetical protein BDF19DRAFT_170865 [Syncephalis fuscata]|nr:hypothetical protein BDF19DRAFT_170865 [Syncephalis fuscata]
MMSNTNSNNPATSMHHINNPRSVRASTPTTNNGPNFFGKMPSTNTGPTNTAHRKPELILCTQQTEYDWNPRLILPPFTSGQPGPEYAPSVELRPVHVQPVLGRFFILDPEYRIAGVLPRGCYSSLHQLQIKFSFVFQFPQHSWFEDMAGMRKSAYFMIRERGSNTPWELHLKPARDKQTLFGYICEPTALRNCAVQQIQHLLNSRRLPLVLDLDDTLVRLISDDDPVRYVPEKQAATVPERIRTLRDGRRVVVTPGVETFLDWAATLFEVSVCSLGEQNYVSDVADVLDPGKTRIQGLRHSARPELDFAVTRGARDTPPKNLDALYNFCYLPVGTPHPTEAGFHHLVSGADAVASSAWHNTTIGSVINREEATSTRQQWFYQPFFGMPLIVDDTTRSWPASQQDNIVVVRERCPRQRPSPPPQPSPPTSTATTTTAIGPTPMDVTPEPSTDAMDTTTPPTTTTNIATTDSAHSDEMVTAPVAAVIDSVNETAAAETRPEDVNLPDNLISNDKSATTNNSNNNSNSNSNNETTKPTAPTTSTSTDLLPKKEVWSVDLLTWVKEVLGWVHAEFFRRYDRAGLDAVLRGQVTPVVVYKEWLRGLLAERIARSV